MRRFTKRVLTGVLSGAMALSLFPATGFDVLEPKAADVTFNDMEWDCLPGDTYQWVGNITSGFGEEERGYQVTAVTVPDEYKDYVWVMEGEDQDGDGHPDGFQLMTSTWYDEEGNMIQKGAERMKDAVGKTVPLTLTYAAIVDGVTKYDVTGTTQYNVNFKDEVCDFRKFSSVGSWWYIPGMSDEIEVEVDRRTAFWDENTESFGGTMDSVEGVSLGFKPYDEPEPDDIVRISFNGSIMKVDVADVDEEVVAAEDPFFRGYGGELYATLNGQVIAKEDFGFSILDHVYAFTPTKVDALDNLKLGESVTVSPKVTYYDYFTAKQGTEVEGAVYGVRGYDEDLFDVKDNGDNTFTITRKGGWNGGIQIYGDYVDKDGEEQDLASGFFIEDLEMKDIGYMTEKDDLFVVFDDTKARTYSVDLSKVDKLLASDYELQWKVGRGFWGNGFVFTDVFEDGVTVSADKSSVTLDGTKLISYFDVNSEENRIEGNDRFVVSLSAKIPSIDDEIAIFADEVSMRLASVDYNDLVHEGDPDWGYGTELIPGDVFYLDNFYYRAENDANPKGRYIPFDIQVTGVTRDDGGEAESGKFATVEVTEVNGRPAVKAIDTLPAGADENDLFCNNRVDFTYVDANGETKTGQMYVATTDFVQEAEISSVAASGKYDMNIDIYGSYHINTLAGEEVEVAPYLIVRRYDRESHEVTVEYPSDLKYSYDRHWTDSNGDVNIKDGMYTFTGDDKESGSAGIGGDVVMQYVYNWTNGDGSSGVSLQEARKYVDVHFNTDYEFVNGLNLDSLNSLKTIEWTPSCTQFTYDREVGKFIEEDSTDWHRYGFVYDPEDVSITVDGKEIGDSLSMGPFTITSKSDKDVKVVLVKADYDEYRGTVRYTGNRNDLTGQGVRKDAAHDEHLWSESEGIKAGIGKEGTVIKTCGVGGEQITEVVPAIKSITLDKTKLAYTGANQTVNVIVKDTAGNVIDPVYYTATNTTKKNAGTYKVVVTFDNYKYEGTKTLTYTIKKPVLKYRAYVQKKNWMSFQTAAVSATADTKTMAGTTDNLRMETIQMQLSGVGGEVRYRAYCQKKGWVGVGTATGGWATTANKNTNAGTKGESRRVEMIQLQTKGEVSNLYDIYYQAYSEKFGWLAWAGNNEKAGSAGYAYKLEAFRVQLVPKGAKFDKTKGASKKKSFYDKTKDGANPK